MKKIPVIITNRDLLTWPKDMINKIKQYDNVGEIIILDNGSTYQPLLDWYSTKPCEIIKIDNLGHSSPWDSGLIKKLNSKYYIVSDPDLGIKDTPNDTINYLLERIDKYNLPKLGLGLEWEPTPFESPYYNHIINYEKARFESSKKIDNIHLNVAIDTVFALYNKIDKYFIGGCSTGGEYRAKHFPWYFTAEERENNEEFSYYLKHANNSCSYKTFLKL